QSISREIGGRHAGYCFATWWPMPSSVFLVELTRVEAGDQGISLRREDAFLDCDSITPRSSPGFSPLRMRAAQTPGRFFSASRCGRFRYRRSEKLNLNPNYTCDIQTDRPHVLRYRKPKPPC